AVDLLILVEPPPPRLDLRWLHRMVTVLHRLRGLSPDESMTRFLQLEERWRQLTARIFGGSGAGRGGGGLAPALPPRRPPGRARGTAGPISSLTISDVWMATARVAIRAELLSSGHAKTVRSWRNDASIRPFHGADWRPRWPFTRCPVAI